MATRQARGFLTQLLDSLKPIFFAKKIAELMRQYVPVLTGYLRSTIYYTDHSVGASAWYAGYVIDRGDDFVSKALSEFRPEDVVEAILNR